MKQKIFLVVAFIAGLVLNLSAQQSEEGRIRVEGRDRARIVERSTGERAGGINLGPIGMGKDEQRVSLNLSKHFSGESISSDADFEVAEGHSSISMNLSGSCTNGDITITIIQPNGDIMKEQKITNAADIRWSIIFPIKEGDEKKYVGKWKLSVEANKAEGRYNLNINTR